MITHWTVLGVIFLLTSDEIPICSHALLFNDIRTHCRKTRTNTFRELMFHSISFSFFQGTDVLFLFLKIVLASPQLSMHYENFLNLVLV